MTQQTTITVTEPSEFTATIPVGAELIRSSGNRFEFWDGKRYVRAEVTGKIIANDGHTLTVRWGTWYQRFYQWLRRVWLFTKWRMIEKLLDFVDGER